MLVEKQQRLETRLRSLESIVVAFSGGVDSALVLSVAKLVLGPKVLAVTAQSLKAAKNLAREIGVEHIVIQTDEMSSFKYRENSTERCYYCKSELYSKLRTLARKKDFKHIINGINSDDMGDHRPGILAADNAGVLSPLRDLDFSKEDVRSLSLKLGLAVWKKPAAACLSSRIPYNQPISPEKLSMIEKAEDYLLSLGFTQVRVRHHGDVARIELLKKEMSRFFEGEHSKSTQKHFKELGFRFITLDIEGFRSGSLNHIL